MKIKQLSFIILAGSMAIMASCSKKENTQISTPPLQVGQAVSDTAPLTGSIKGTMLSGKTYTISGDVTVNEGDTLLVQKGVKVYMTNNADVIVKGTLLSLGTKEQPNYFTVKDAVKTNDPNVNPDDDDAYKGLWTGINCDVTCKLLVLKWTHIEFGGGVYTTPPVTGTKANDNSFVVLFQNVDGVFVMEDSWVYGGIDDPIRLKGGKFNLMRNTFEKCGKTGGDVMNAKSGSVGNMAYNLIIGSATTGTKASNKGGAPVQCNVNMYNNTYINGGYRRLESGRGGSVNYEEGSRGNAFNNLIVDCRFGFRVVNDPLADTLNLKYGNTYNYNSTLETANEIYPTGYITKPKPSDIPIPSSFLPASYALGDIYDGSSVVAKNDPKFMNYPLPQSNFKKISTVGTYDFHLSASSPCVGKGTTTAFSPLNVVPVDPNYGSSEITPPGKDIGAFQTDGTGNQH
ncbi:hypothetical protein I5M32_02415 [Pedobacter sp. SD-b]|uniref:Right handed beta helix region n=1 Tax=Pedobacter segetis TaxID=2793069 RepID=A0ABS1BG08_9SPHI|nr:hypothetical protein [Pedobacter segetis]MBK0381802.1 hypothetical protein [Pedobacter segetis]